jgi:hypothetical protein
VTGGADRFSAAAWPGCRYGSAGGALEYSAPFVAGWLYAPEALLKPGWLSSGPTGGCSGACG